MVRTGRVRGRERRNRRKLRTGLVTLVVLGTERAEGGEARDTMMMMCVCVCVGWTETLVWQAT